MQILYWFEKIRNPVLDFFFSAVTYLGDEIALMAIAILLFWCVNKRSGYYILISGFLGTLVNQTLKLACKIERPWDRDKKFTIVESAREAATGYSFPSGHSQNSVTIFGAIFLTSRAKWLKILCVVIAVLVPVSRMYLGVHTFWDVLAGSACAIMLLLILENFFKNDKIFHKAMPIMLAVLTLGAIAFFLYAVVFTPMSDDENAISAAKNAKTLIGCSAGLILVYLLDRFVIKFETKASWYVQIIKVVVGFAVILCIQKLLKAPLFALVGDYERIIRYFLMVAFGGAVWPMTFKYLSKIKIPALDRLGDKISSRFVKKEEPAVEEAPKKKRVFPGVKNKNTSKK